MLFVPRQAQAGTSQIRSNLPLEVPVWSKKTEVRYLPAPARVSLLTHKQEIHLTIGSETSGTMLHWILQPLQNEGKIIVHENNFC